MILILLKFVNVNGICVKIIFINYGFFLKSLKNCYWCVFIKYLFVGVYVLRYNLFGVFFVINNCCVFIGGWELDSFVRMLIEMLVSDEYDYVEFSFVVCNNLFRIDYFVLKEKVFKIFKDNVLYYYVFEVRDEGL